MRVARFAALLSVSAVLGGAVAEPPKPPNPKDPVDYVAAIRAQHTRKVMDNAADGYLAALKSFQNDEELAKIARRADASSWTQAERTKLGEWVKNNEKCLDEIVAASRKRVCFFPFKSDDGSLFGVMVPELPQLRAASCALSARARLRTLDGNSDAAVDDVGALLRISKHLSEQPLLIQYVVGISTSALAYDALLDFPRLKPDLDYAKIVRLLRSEDSEIAPPAQQFRVEQMMLYDIAQRLLKDSDDDGKFDAFAREGLLGEEKPPPFNPQTLDEMVKNINQFTEQMLLVCDAKPSGFRDACAKVDTFAKDSPSTIVRAFGGTSRAVILHRRRLAARAAWVAVYRLHQFHADRKSWPATLTEAIPKSNQSLVIDPFTGESLRYKLQNGAPLLYTVGDDGKDDGGAPFLEEGKPAWGTTGDYVFWPRPTGP